MSNSQATLTLVPEMFEVPSTVYADQLVQMGAGPAVIKLVFATLDNPTAQPKPVQMIVMPTITAIQMAQQILSVFGSPQMQERIETEKGQFNAILESLKPFASLVKFPAT